MAFVETRFPTDIAFGATGGPEYSTDIVITHSGYEQRNANWSQARARYNVAHGVKTQAQLNTLIAFFRARKGRADGFRFKDWTDYQVNNQLIGTGDGTTTAFQFVKTYTDGGVTETRIINKPVAGSTLMFINGSLQSGSHFSVNTVTGIVTFTSPPGAGLPIVADFQFDVPVRFDTDRLAASIDAYNTNSWRDIPLVGIRV